MLVNEWKEDKCIGNIISNHVSNCTQAKIVHQTCAKRSLSCFHTFVFVFSISFRPKS